MFNARIYSGDGEVHYDGSYLGSGKRIGTIRFNEDGLDMDKLSIKSPHVNRMNRAVFEMKPVNIDVLNDMPKREGYCGLHQKYPRVQDMNEYIGRKPLAEYEKRLQKRQPWLGKEGFSSSNGFESTANQVYKTTIKSTIMDIINILNSIECFDIERSKWIDMKHNLDRKNWNINILPPSDSDVAYSLNKGEELNFKSRDYSNYMPVKILTYVICHELAHVACNRERGHTETFTRTMYLLECAAFMANRLRPSTFPVNDVHISDMDVVSRKVVVNELLIGFNILKSTGKNTEYIDSIIEYLHTL